MEKEKEFKRPPFWDWEKIVILSPDIDDIKYCIICQGKIDSQTALEVVIGNDLIDGRVAICEDCARYHASNLMDAFSLNNDRITYAEDMQHLFGVIYEVLKVRAEREESV